MTHGGPVLLLLTAAALLFRWQGDAWLVAGAKLAMLVVLGALRLRF